MGTGSDMPVALGPIDLGHAYRDLHPKLLRAARTWAPAGTEDDVVQETWAVVVAKIDQFEGRSTLSTWVLGILWRKSARLWRDRDRDRDRLRFDNDSEQQRYVADESPWSNPERRATNRVEAAIVIAAIDELPEMYREVLLLRDVLDQSAEAAEAQLGISRANQRVRLHRARQKVREALEGFAVEGFAVAGRFRTNSTSPLP